VARALGLGLPFGLALGASLLIRPEADSLIAPWLGPWAGLAYDHLDCTMGTQLPALSFALAGLGALALPATVLARGRLAVAATALASAWAVAWELLALMSVANTTS